MRIIVSVGVGLLTVAIMLMPAWIVETYQNIAKPLLALYAAGWILTAIIWLRYTS